MSRFRKDLGATVALNRADGLFRGLAFACLAGQGKGFASGGIEPYRDNVYRQQGTWSGSFGPDNYGVINGGRALRGGTPSVDDIAFNMNASLAGSVDAPVFGAGFTLMALFQPTSATGTDDGFFGRKATNVSGAGGFWLGTGLFGTRFMLEIANGGASEAHLQSTTSWVVGQTYLVVGSWDSVNMRIYVNGVLENTLVPGFTPINAPSTEGFKYFNGDGTTRNNDGFIPVAAYWKRALTPGEVNRLNSDPYIVWRNSLHKEFMFGNVGGSKRFQTFFLNFG